MNQVADRQLVSIWKLVDGLTISWYFLEELKGFAG